MLSLLFFFLPAVFAKSISTPYLTFLVPDSYQCVPNVAYYQCQDSTGPRMKDSILIVTFKRIGPQDSTDQYMSLLSKPFTRVNPNAPPSLSKVISVDKVQINGWEWVAAKHYESDLANYMSYIWTTTRGAVAMVVKYSVLNKNEAARLGEIQMIRNSLLTKNVAFSPPAEATPGSPGSFAPAPIPTAASVAAEKSTASLLEKVMNLPPIQKYILAVAFIFLVVLGFYALAKK